MALLALPLLCGCTSWVKITSEPAGARVLIEGKDYGRTPVVVRVESSPWARKGKRITLTHPACLPFSTELRQGLLLPRDKRGKVEAGKMAPAAVYGAMGTVAAAMFAPGLLVVPAAFASLRGPIPNQHFVLARRGGAGTLKNVVEKPAAYGALVADNLKRLDGRPQLQFDAYLTYLAREGDPRKRLALLGAGMDKFEGTRFGGRVAGLIPRP